MTGLRIGYARVSTNDQDLTSLKYALMASGVTPEKNFTDQGRTGTNRAPSGLSEAMAACRAGDTSVVMKLDRMARSLRDAKDIVDELTGREVKLSIGGSVHDPIDPVGKLLFNVLAMVAEFEADLIRARTREGMAVARTKGRLRGKPPRLSSKLEAHLVELHRAGNQTTTELGELFSVARSTVYRALRRAMNQSSRVAQFFSAQVSTLDYCAKSSPVQSPSEIFMSMVGCAGLESRWLVCSHLRKMTTTLACIGTISVSGSRSDIRASRFCQVPSA